jgi:hypothetical protein
MQGPEPFLIFTRKLNRLGVPYMISGSVAAIFYGEPRMTNDVDIIVLLKNDDLPKLTAAFPLDEFYCPPEEVMKTSFTTKPASKPTSTRAVTIFIVGG